MPMAWAAAAMAGANLIGGAMGANAAKDAAETQAGATRYAADQQRKMFNIVNAQQAAGRGAGYGAFNTIRSMMPGQYTTYDEKGNPIGMAEGDDYLTKQFTAEDFLNNMDPSYQFRLNLGREQAERQANQGGGFIGGNALKGLQDYTQGSASTEFANSFNRFQTQRSNIYNTLASIAGLGQAAQSQSNQLAQNYMNNQTGLTTAGAAATAAGQIGAVNALSGGLQGAGSSYALYKMMQPQQSAPDPRLMDIGNSTSDYGSYVR